MTEGVLTPSERKFLGEVVKVVSESLRNVLVNGVMSEGQVTGEHSRPVEFVGYKSVRISSLCINSFPLRRTVRALYEGPIVLQQRVKELCNSSR